MKYLKFLLNAYVFWLAVSIIGSFGCAGLFPYPMADYYPKFICITPVNETSPENNLPLVVTPTTPSGSCAKWNPPLVPSTPGASNISDGLVTNAEVYCKKCRDKENNSTIREIGFDDMRGAGWIQTCYEDRLGRDPNYLVLTFNSLINVEGIYIAYDSKVPSNNRPTWLKDNYIQQKNPVTGAPEYITVNNPDIAGNISTMHIWRFNKTLGNSMTIPGNLYGTPTLPPGIDPKVAMYFVIVNPKKTYKPGPVTLNPYKYDNCTYESTNCNQRDDQERAQCVDDVKNKVTDAAKKDCAQMVGGKTQVCGVTVCYGPYDTCPPPPPACPTA